MNSEEETVAKYIMQNPINLSTIEVANSCIQCFHSQENPYNCFPSNVYRESIEIVHLKKAMELMVVTLRLLLHY